MEPMVSNSELNDLFIVLSRSLLQYAGEAWPWAPLEEQQEQAEVERIIASQHISIQELGDLLIERHVVIDPGAYPTQYTSLHYVALDYLFEQLIANQQRVVEEIQRVNGVAVDDPQLRDVLATIYDREQSNLSDLRKLAENSAHVWVKI